MTVTVTINKTIIEDESGDSFNDNITSLPGLIDAELNDLLGRSPPTTSTSRTSRG